MGNYLRLRFMDDGDGTGKLMARAEADGFSGEGGAYFNVEELEEFAEALRVFPPPLDDHRRSIASGFCSKEDPPIGLNCIKSPVRRTIGIPLKGKLVQR